VKYMQEEVLSRAAAADASKGAIVPIRRAPVIPGTLKKR